MTDTTKKQKEDFFTKECLYKVYLDIKSQIKDKALEIDKEEYEETINSSTIKQLSGYIIDSIEILVNTKIKEARKKFETDLERINSENKKVTNFDLYENLLRKAESKNRRLTKLHFQSRLQKEALELKIAEYMDMEDEFEEMKTKYKYENGKFLNNDRKDNEILILRTENTNIKKAISGLEKKILEGEVSLKEKEKTIKGLNSKISELNKQLEQKERELNLCSNVNICINNCGECNNAGKSNCSCFYVSSKDKKGTEVNTHTTPLNMSTHHQNTTEHIPSFRQTGTKLKRGNTELNSSASNVKYYPSNQSCESNTLKDLSIKYLSNNSKKNNTVNVNTIKKKVISDNGINNGSSSSTKTSYKQFPGYPIIQNSSSKAKDGNIQKQRTLRKEFSYGVLPNRKNFFN